MEGISPVDQFAYHDDTTPIESWEEYQKILEGMVEDHTYPRPKPEQQTSLVEITTSFEEEEEEVEV